MSLLIVQLPAQPRLAAQPTDATASEADAAELGYVFSADGREVSRQGRCPPAELPPADECVAVLAPGDTSWHRLTLPKASGPRLRLALSGLLEEALLDDESELHLALPPQARSGEAAWVAVCGKPWLRQQIDRLEAAGRAPDRIVPGWTPDGPPAAHAFGHDPEALTLAWRDADGVLCLPLDAATVRLLQARLPEGEPVTWSASPEAAEAAAALAGAPVAAVAEAERLREAAASAWNLRQFDLVARHRGQRAAREWMVQAWRAPAWRPARIGLVTLLAVQLVGANVWAWQQHRALAERRQAMTALLQTAFPQVKAVIDAPAQMQKEMDRLRTAAGRPADGDLEPLLYGAEAAWPPGRGPATHLHFEPGRLTLGSPGWTPQDLDGFRSRLRPLGLDAEPGPGGPTVVKARPGSLPPPAGPGTAPPPGGPGLAPPAPGGAAPRPMSAAPADPAEDDMADTEPEITPDEEDAQ